MYRMKSCCQFVVRLLLHTKGYRLPRYRQHVAGNKQHVARQHVACCQQQVARPRNMLSGNMLPWCKRGLTHFKHVARTSTIGPSKGSCSSVHTIEVKQGGMHVVYTMDSQLCTSNTRRIQRTSRGHSPIKSLQTLKIV